MKKLVDNINGISFVILTLLSISTLGMIYTLDSVGTYDNVSEVILCYFLIMAGIIYVTFSCYSIFVYKNGTAGLLFGFVAIVIGTIDLMNLMFFNIWDNSILKIIIATMLFFLEFKGIKTVVALIDNNNKLKYKEEMLKASIAMIKGAQIKSHFVFNILNSISAMCKYDPEKADEAIVRFSRIMRANMDILEDDKVIPFNDVMEQLDNYVILEKIRFREKFIFKKEINFSDFKFPLLILQPLIENAIKHGVTPKAEGGYIFLKTWKDKDTIYIEVKDDGIGFDLKTLETKESIGLNNIKFRLDYMLDGDLTIDSEPQNGTKVTIKIPCKEDK